MGIDAEDAHAALRPEIARYRRLDAGLDEAHNEGPTERLALETEQLEVRIHSLPASGRAASSHVPWFVRSMFARSNLP